MSSCPALANQTRNKKAFDEFKTIISTKYIYRDYKKIHWPSLYAKHEYKILASHDDTTFAENLNELVLELKDSHFNVFDENGTRISSHHGSSLKKNYNLDAIVQIVGNLTQLNSSVFVGSVGTVGYLMIKDWNFSSEESAKILPESLFADNFSGLNGLIIDVRMNSGGQLSSCELFAGRFASYRQLAAYRHSFDLSGKLVKQEYHLRGIGAQYSKPVIVLMGNRSASACEHFILQMQTVASVKTMGDNSAGSTGLPRQYELSNGVSMSVPSAALMDLRNTYIEEYGIKPDERIPFINDKSDNVLVKAFQKLGVNLNGRNVYSPVSVGDYDDH
jgi:C-terminal processing protease CtpA/Prc